jgi:hypothetical protein
MISRIEGTIETVHDNAACVAAALAPDNMQEMTTEAAEGRVVMRLAGTRLRTVLASLDDYLMNLAVAEDACFVAANRSGDGKTDGQDF